MMTAQELEEKKGVAVDVVNAAARGSCTIRAEMKAVFKELAGQRDRIAGLEADAKSKRDQIEGLNAEVGLLRGVSGPVLRRSVVEAAQQRLMGLPDGIGALEPQESWDEYIERLSQATWLERYQLTPDAVRLLHAGKAFVEGCTAAGSTLWKDRGDFDVICLDGVAEEDKPHWRALFRFAWRC